MSADPESIIWIDGDVHGEANGDVPDTGSDPGVSRVGLLAGVLLAAVASVLFFAAADDTESRAAREQADSLASESGPPAPAATQAPTTTIGNDDLLAQLPTTPDEWVDGLVLSWVDGDGTLHARTLDGGDDLPVSVLAQTNLPPLPDHVHLLGAENSTWLLDLEQPERSGKLSNTVRMVRFGTGLDSYGFSSVDADGRTEFFVGSLWGPAMNGLAEVDANTTVFSVPGAGIISSGRDATSAVLRGSGFEALPSRLGRIVAASSDRVAGIHCDDLGRCVGRISQWDGSGEVQVSVDPLTLPVVRISPDGRTIVSGGGSTLMVLDLDDGSTRQSVLGLAPDDSLVWSPDSTTVFFMVDGSVVAIRVADPELSITRVRQIGDIGLRLVGADVAVFDNPG